ncbi:hypothetical protein QBC37DRAFT_398824 [Rhypophila decipiens]|uniref:Uncharacterized protein n=1 Tax=Rhypophila decipiens TaxID=261697 RepID=A0AAN6Y9N1_9PEZI|nr:hypothetical protein QBC37DRAFT_398824 [Rhypophila decipiens]
MDDVHASTEYARATAHAIDALLQGDALQGIKNGNNSDPVVKNLTKLAIRLQQFRQHSGQLDQWLRVDASMTSPKIRNIVAELAKEGRRVSVVVFNEIDKASGGGAVDIDPAVLAEYDDVLAAFIRVFILFSQLLSGDGDKDSKLNHPDAHQLVENAQRVSEKVLSSRSALLEMENPRLPTIKTRA